MDPVLAGQDTQAPDIQAPSEAPDIGALAGEPIAPPPNEFAGKVADGANAAAASMPAQAAAQPGAWARGLLAGVQDALAGFGAGGRVPPGAGGLYGMGTAARQIQAHRDALQQQGFENQLKQQQMSRQEAIARATIAHENAATAYQQQLSAHLSETSRQENITSGKVAADAFLKGGAPVIQEGLDSDEIQQLIKEKKLDPTKAHAFPTGEQTTVDDKGNPVTRPTYTIFGDVPNITIDAAQAKLISDNTFYKLPEGTKMSGITAGHLLTMAQAGQTAQLAIDESLEEAKIKKGNLEVTEAAQKFRPDFGLSLGKTGGNVERALTDPMLLRKYPDAAELAANLYGGEDKLTTVMDKQSEDAETQRKNRVEEAQKQEEITQKKQASGDYMGDPEAADPQQFLASLQPNEQAVVKMIGEGRAPLNNPAYLLARKPEIMAAVSKAYPGFDASKVKSYQDTYKDYTSGKVSQQLTAAATALEHLSELRKLNTITSRVPGTKDHQAYQNKVDTVASELAKFYGNDTVPGIESYRKTLASAFNRDAAITTQAKSMGDRLDNVEQEWTNAAPSKQYQAPMPHISLAAKQARASMDPSYRPTVMMKAPTGQMKPVPIDQVDHYEKLGATPAE